MKNCVCRRGIIIIRLISMRYEVTYSKIKNIADAIFFLVTVP